MTLLHSPAVARWLSRHLLLRVEGVHDRFVLTFDDGPSPTWTPRMLDLLARHGAHATFFLLGKKARRNGALARRIVAEGQEVGLHGDWHFPPQLMPAATFRAELARGTAAIAAAAGAAPRFYRAPFGVLTPGRAALVRALGLVPTLGDVYPDDPARPGAKRIVARSLARLRAGSILMLHDSSATGDADRSQTLEAVGAILVATALRGLHAVAVRDLLQAAPQLPNRFSSQASTSSG